MALYRFGSFLMKRVHSFFGLALTFFLMEHLYTNSQAALTKEGSGFVEAVNFLQSIPHLWLVEIILLALPFFVHIIWGFSLMARTKLNSKKGDGSVPSLGHFKKNRAFTWQRATALLLTVGVIWHVYDMRFSKFPMTSDITGSDYVVQVKKGVVSSEEKNTYQASVVPEYRLVGDVKTSFGAKKWEELTSEQQNVSMEYIKTPEVGAAVLFNLKSTFKSVWVSILYSLLVLFATYHAFNGVWTLMYTWGIAKKDQCFSKARILTTALMIIFSLLGLTAIWFS